MKRFLFLLFIYCLSGSAALAAHTIVDSDGTEITFDRPFTRIISLYPAHTENLFSLGLDREIIGVSTSDDYPPMIKDRRRFGYREDAEKFIAARPDLVLIRPMISRAYRGLIDKLRRAGITVVSLQPVGPAEIYGYWRQLGQLTGRTQEAQAMTNHFRHELDELRKLTNDIPPEKRKVVYFESIHSRMKTFAPNGMAIFVLQAAGGINAAGDADQVRNTNIAAYGKERILSHASEIDVFLAQQGRMNRVDIDTIKNEPGFAAIKAVRKNRIFLIDEKIVSRPTLRMLEGIRTIARYLYPEHTEAIR